MKRLAFPAAMLAAMPACAQAAPAARTGHARIDAFVADIAAGRREAAIAKVSSIESASGLPNAVATPAELVDKLLHCSYVSVRTLGVGTTMYDITWHCPDGDYRSLIDPDWRPPRLTVGQFDSAVVLDERRRNPRPPSPPPPPPRPAPAAAQRPPEPRVTDAERDALAAAVSRGDLEALRAVVGRYVLLFDGGLDFRRSSPEALIEATRGCRLFAADRTGNDPAMWFRLTCPGRPRGAIRAWEEPGVYIKLWHHPAGMLAAFFYPGPVEVRSPPRGAFAPPPPPPSPRRPAQ